MGIGFIRPHTPMVAPQKYFDMFPLDGLQLPKYLKEDTSDTHYRETKKEDAKGYRYMSELKKSYKDDELALKKYLQAYLACVAAVDDCIGQVMSALDNSPLKDNTIVVLTSDHGWQMGEKNYLFKNSPWEKSTRIPLIIRAPQVSKTGVVCDTPVSLIDIYPTLIDLCELPKQTMKNKKGRPLSGFSMKPLLKAPQNGTWQGPDVAISMVFGGENTPDGQKYAVQSQHYSLRSKDYRYIRYNTGKEELYDHHKDPHEWTNLAQKAEYKAALETMRAHFEQHVPQNDEHLVDVDLGTW